MEPTATQKVGEAHDTPEKKAFCGGAGLGLGVIAQPEPLDVSIRVCANDPFVYDPTATQKVAAHEVPARSFSVGPGTSGLGTIAHGAAALAPAGTATLPSA